MCKQANIKMPKIAFDPAHIIRKEYVKKQPSEVFRKSRRF